MGDATIWVSVDLPGFHRWPEAPERRAYLRDRHRHLFQVIVVVAVRNDDRDVEFHDLQETIRRWWGVSIPDLGALSCEAIARRIGKVLIDSVLSVISVDVSEDGENGATVHFGERG